LTAPYTVDGPYSFWMMELDDQGLPLPEKWHQATINPYDGTVLGIRDSWGTVGHLGTGRREIIRSIYDLHRSLLLGATGETVVGFSGFFLVGTLLSGLYLWWPKLINLRRSLMFKRNTSLQRNIYDWHTLTGLYTSTLLMVIALSGIYLAFPDEVKSVVRLFSGVHEIPHALQSNHDPASQQRSIEQWLPNVLSTLDGTQLETLYFPILAEDTYQLNVKSAVDIGIPHRFGELIINGVNGNVLYRFDHQNANAGDKLLMWLLPLHNGEAFGTIGRAVVCFVGITPTVLWITGFIRSRQKRRRLG
jgi:uncharacterized iron-regulated membrane protein